MIVYAGRLYQRFSSPLQPFEGVIVWRSFGTSGVVVSSMKARMLRGVGL